MSSLFGSLNNTQKSDYGGLFGAPKPATTTSGGLFSTGAASTSAPQTGGLFGSAGLGNSTQTSQPAQTSTTGGLGGLGGLGLGAGSNTQQNAGGSVFGPGATLQQAQQNGLGNSTAVPLQSSQQSGQNTGYFDTILENSRKRAHAETLSEDLPQLQLGLGDLRQRIKRLGTGQQDGNVDSRAHYLLAASGVDPGAAVRDLDHLTTATTRADRPQSQVNHDTDVESYLSNLQTQTTLSMIADGLARSVRDFDAFLEDNVTMEWDAQRKRIYQHFGIRPREGAIGGKGSFAASVGEGQGGFGRSRRSKAAALAGSRAGGLGESTFGRSTLQKSVIGAAGPVGTGHQPLFADVEKNMEASGVLMTGPHDRLQRDKQSKYAEKVQVLNLARLNRHPFPISKEFSDVALLTGDQHSPDLVKAYRALAEIVGENPAVKSFGENSTATERQFAEAYLGDASGADTELKKRIIRGGARCLERLAFEKMEDMVAKNPRDANLGGIPNVINKVKAYVRLLAVKKNLAADNTDLLMIGDDYVWALIYFLLRTGHVSEADEYVRNNAVAFRAIDRNFAAYMHAYATSPERRLDGQLQSRINNEYTQRIRLAPENSLDPYMMACYKVIGRCDLKQRSLDGLNQGVEDWVWIQLVLAREINRVEAMASEIFGLVDAQNTIREIGNRFFAKGGAEIGSSFGAFVFLQIALGMFEEAVSYLYTYSYVDGVHLAIALDFYGLLRVSDPNAGGEDLLSLTTRSQSQISFGRMVGLYTRDFRAANVSAAVDYLALICLNQDLPGQGGSNQVALCHEALREIVLESREFALLLGDMRSDGQRITGVIEQRMGLIGLDQAGDFMRTITMQAASIANDNGRTTDAVLLYHLAGEYDNVIVTINRALSEAISVPIGQEPLKLQPLKARSTNGLAAQNQDTESSLTSVDDPITLAEKMKQIYEGKQMFNAKVKEVNWSACSTLLAMDAAKSCVENGQWTQALDTIDRLKILPLDAAGNAAQIRYYATKFSALAQPVAQNVPNLLMWAIVCCNKQRTILANSQFGGNEGTRQAMSANLKQMNMDLTTYTSQLRYRFPAHIHEALARAQSE